MHGKEEPDGDCLGEWLMHGKEEPDGDCLGE